MTRRRHDPIVEAIPLGIRDSGGQSRKREPSVIASGATRRFDPAAGDTVEFEDPCFAYRDKCGSWADLKVLRRAEVGVAAELSPPSAETAATLVVAFVLLRV